MLGGMSKNEEIQFFGSQIYFPVINYTINPKVSASMVGYAGLTKNSRNIRERKNP